MSSHMLPPNPCLVAVLLVVKGTSEPRLVFHYPPRPGEDNANLKYLFKDDRTDTSSTSSDSESSLGETPKEAADEKGTLDAGSPAEADEVGSASPLKDLGPLRISGKKSQWNDLFGYQSGVLAKALCPVSGAQRKFELKLGENVYLGRPFYANEDETWKRKRRRSSSMSKSLGGKGSLGALSNRSKAKLSGVSDTTSVESAASDTDSRTPSSGGPSKIHPHEGGNEGNDINQQARTGATSGQHKIKDPLLMFHVVFVLQPPPLEYHARVKDLWKHIVWKFSKALRYEQAKFDYVSKEASLISSIVKRLKKAAGDNLPLQDLYHEVISQSRLAKAIALLYNGVSSSRIVHLPLTPSFSISLQIPVPRSISSLPTPLMRQTPGLWLTTANTLPADEDISPSNTHLESHFTLLLLNDVQSIVADANAAKSPISASLIHFLSVIKPTKSFYQISQSSGIALPDIRFLASHLIYWRRAQAVHPLHQRDFYIVSPNADMLKLASASVSFAKAFPTLPPLPKLLSLLSVSPRPWSSVIPSKDHKNKYMDILAWLLRDGWVTQLRSFAWVLIPSHIKSSVDQESQGADHIEHTDKAAKPDKEPQPKLEIPNILATSPTSSTGTAIPLFDSTTVKSSQLICNPRLASAIPSRYLDAVSQYIGKVQGSDPKTAWDKCVRYFDGKHAIESIATSEGWKRKHVADLVVSWEGLGLLMKTRHW